jgi:hypothetical protein
MAFSFYSRQIFGKFAIFSAQHNFSPPERNPGGEFLCTLRSMIIKPLPLGDLEVTPKS